MSVMIRFLAYKYVQLFRIFSAVSWKVFYMYIYIYTILCNFPPVCVNQFSSIISNYTSSFFFFTSSRRYRLIRFFVSMKVLYERVCPSVSHSVTNVFCLPFKKLIMFLMRFESLSQSVTGVTFNYIWLNLRFVGVF